MRYLRSKKLVLEEERMHPFDLNKLPIEAEEGIEEVLDITRGTKTEQPKLLYDRGQSSKTENENVKKVVNITKARLKTQLEKIKAKTHDGSIDSQMLQRWQKKVNAYNSNNPEQQTTLSGALSSLYSESELIAIALQSKDRFPQEGTPRRRILDETLQSWANSSPPVSATDAFLQIGLQPIEPDVLSPQYTALLHYLDILNEGKEKKDKVLPKMALKKARELTTSEAKRKLHAPADTNPP